MRKFSVLRSDAIFFYLSFFSAGTQSILTQLFLKNNYPDIKEILLPLTLILGALSYICGIYFSTRYLKTSYKLIKLFFCINIISFIILIFTKQFFIYIFFYVTACFSCNLIFNTCDHYSVNNGSTGLNHHIKAILVFQLMAYIFSPLFFSLNSDNTILCTAVIILLSITVGVLSLKNIGSHIGEEIQNDSTNTSQGSLDFNDKVFIIYIVIFLSLVNIATSMLTYFMSEYYMFENYAFKTGLLLMIMSVSAGIAVAVYKNPLDKLEVKDIRDLKTALFRPKLQVLIICAYIINVFLLLMKLSNSFVYIAVILFILGTGYGLFLTSSRKFASAVSLMSGSSKLLSIYNNLQSISLLVGYTISAIIWGFAGVLRLNYYVLVIIVFLVLLSVEILFIALWVRDNKKGSSDKTLSM